MPNPGRRPAVQMRTEDRLAECLRLRRQGLSYRAIGQQIGVSYTQAQRLVDAGLRRISEPDAVELRASELAHLDELSSYIRPGCVDGDPAAVGVAVRISERRSRLLGLDSPTPIALTVAPAPSTSSRDVEFASMAADLAVAQALRAVDAEIVTTAEIEA